MPDSPRYDFTGSLTAGIGRSSDEFVECGGCTACCKKQIVHLTGNENPADYPKGQWVDHPLDGRPIWVLDHLENGDCTYLGPEGCTIYENRPAMCRTFSCIGFYRFFMNLSRVERRLLKKTGGLDSDVMNQGKARYDDKR